jgi:hypothetical protein
MGTMETEGSRTAIERKSEREAENCLRRIGQFETVERFIRTYGNVRTRRVYSHSLLKYLNWLKHERNVLMTPDELISDNLVTAQTLTPRKCCGSGGRITLAWLLWATRILSRLWSQ